MSRERDARCLLDRHVWVTVTDGHTCVYNDLNSIAQNLDVFQHALSRANEQKITCCAISADVDGLKTSPTSWGPESLRGLLAVILEDRWPNMSAEILRYVGAVRDRTLPQLAWKPQLPSRSSAADSSLKEPSLCDLDIVLEWVYKCPKLETFLGSQDWSIYISEPYANHPRVEALRIVVCGDQDSGVYRQLLIATCCDTLKRLKKSHDAAVDNGTIEMSSAIAEQVYGSLSSSLHVITSEIGQYIEASVRLIHELVGRLFPDASCNDINSMS
jgi:hypothetical protein